MKQVLLGLCAVLAIVGCQTQEILITRQSVIDRSPGLEHNDGKTTSATLTVERGQTYLLAVFTAEEGVRGPSGGHIEHNWNITCQDEYILAGSLRTPTRHRIWFEAIKDGDVEQVKQDNPHATLADSLVFTVPNDDVQRVPKKTKAFRSAFRKWFRSHHVSEEAIERGFTSIHVFFCDVDGDGVEEAFAVTPEECDRWGSNWCVFQYQKGKWQAMETGLDRFSGLYAYAWNFYYRDDVKGQPRLFIDTCVRDNPKAVVITKDNRVIEVLVDRRGYEELREEGVLKPIESHWYDKDDRVVLGGFHADATTGTIKGHNKPITPYDSYGDSDWINEQWSVYNTFYSPYQSAIGRCTNPNVLGVMVVDIDGDWLDEWFVTCDAMASDTGSEWHVFYGQHEEWQELNVTGMTNRLCAPASRFYYRDDTKEQPRVFIDTCVTNPPLALSLWDKKNLYIAPFDRQEYESLREKGILKPVGCLWENTKHGLGIRSIEGDNKPIQPRDRFPYEDAVPGLEPRLNLDGGLAAGYFEYVYLTGDKPRDYINKKFSNLPLTIPRQKYVFAVFASDSELPVPAEDLIPLEWNIKLPDGQMFVGSTNVYSLQRTWFTVVEGSDLEHAKKIFSCGHLLDYRIVTVPDDDEREIKTEQDMRAFFIRAVYKHFACHSASEWRINNVIFFDTDGDGLSDEAVFLTRAGAVQHDVWYGAFYFKDGAWRQRESLLVASYLSPWDFFYRDGIEPKAHLFTRQYCGFSPVKFVCSDWGWGWTGTGMSENEFEEQVENGTLKRIPWYWCDENNNLHTGEN